MDLVVTGKKSLKGQLVVPADKSISHRSAMCALLTGGSVVITNYSRGADCCSTLDIIKNLGCDICHLDNNKISINSQNAFKKDRYSLNCGNSGTTMRLFAGIMASREIETTLFGDESLNKRPMRRIITPLELMGAKFKHNDYRAPIIIKGEELFPIVYKLPIASAQVKSCILLAGLNTYGETKVYEDILSRNHTERMLEYLEADISVVDNLIKIKKSKLIPKTITIPGDISSAAFFIVAAAIVPDSDLILKNVGLNPSRIGVIEIMRQMGADIEILDLHIESNEEVGDIRVKFSSLKGVNIDGTMIPKLIDELPVIAVLASQADGDTVVKDAGDLRNKESDRIACLVSELKKIGVIIKETPDGFIVKGKSKLIGDAVVDSFSDHRLAMSFYVAGLICEKPISIRNFEWVDISFPEFLNLMESCFSF